MTPATLTNMRLHYARGVVAYSPGTGEEYSADPSDYWDAPPDWTMTDTEGAPMILVTRETTFRDVAP